MKGISGSPYKIVVILFALLAHQQLMAGELEDRRFIRNQAVGTLEKSDFKKLEKIANEYRSKPVITSSGLWALTFYYRGIAGFASWSAENPDDIWVQNKKRNDRWIKKFPESPTPYVVQAIFLEQLAYSYKFPLKGKKQTSARTLKFQDNMELALQFLIKNKSIGINDPHYYVEMIRVATALRWENKKYRKLVDEAVKKYPMYFQIYFAAVDYYSPRFGGNIDLMDDFARYSVKHTQDKIGMTLYARIYWAAIQSWPSKDVWSKINWDDFKSGIDTVLGSYPDEWNTNNFAFFACVAGDKEKARELISKIKNKPLISVWRSKSNFNKCNIAVGLMKDQGRGQLGI